MPELPTLVAKNFIQRRDAKARQGSTGEYYLHMVDGRADHERLPWKMSDVKAHLAGTATYGHYLLDADSQCRLFAFDIDLAEEGQLPITFNIEGEPVWFERANPREAWRDRKHPGRTWMKYQFRMIAEKLAAVASKELELPVAVAYSGYKGVHVYCFHEPMSAELSRKGAQLVLDTLDEFEVYKGSNFYRHRNSDASDGYPNLSIEVFPKQTSLDGKSLGNLMRLPLGRNLKAKDPTFFVDCTAPMNELRPTDAEFALTTGNPWVKA